MQHATGASCGQRCKILPRHYKVGTHLPIYSRTSPGALILHRDEHPVACATHDSAHPVTSTSGTTTATTNHNRHVAPPPLFFILGPSASTAAGSHRRYSPHLPRRDVAPLAPDGTGHKATTRLLPCPAPRPRSGVGVASMIAVSLARLAGSAARKAWHCPYVHESRAQWDSSHSSSGL